MNRREVLRGMVGGLAALATAGDSSAQRPHRSRSYAYRGIEPFTHHQVINHIEIHGRNPEAAEGEVQKPFWGTGGNFFSYDCNRVVGVALGEGLGNPNDHDLPAEVNYRLGLDILMRQDPEGKEFLHMRRVTLPWDGRHATSIDDERAIMVGWDNHKKPGSGRLAEWVDNVYGSPLGGQRGSAALDVEGRIAHEILQGGVDQSVLQHEDFGFHYNGFDHHSRETALDHMAQIAMSMRARDRYTLTWLEPVAAATTDARGDIVNPNPVIRASVFRHELVDRPEQGSDDFHYSRRTFTTPELVMGVDMQYTKDGQFLMVRGVPELTKTPNELRGPNYYTWAEQGVPGKNPTTGVIGDGNNIDNTEHGRGWVSAQQIYVPKQLQAAGVNKPGNDRVSYSLRDLMAVPEHFNYAPIEAPKTLMGADRFR